MTETPEQKAKRILDMQCPSTRAALERPEDKDAAWRNRQNPLNWLAMPDAKNMDEAIGARPLAFKEVAIEESLRQKRGLMLSDLRGEHYNAKSVTPEKKERAIEAFMSATTVKEKFFAIMKFFTPHREKETVEQVIRWAKQTAEKSHEK